MRLPTPPETSRARDLERILRSTQSLLAYYAPYVEKGRSLRILDLALIAAIADLQQLDDSSLDGTPESHGASEIS